MFLAVVIPKARNSRVIAGVTVISFAASHAAARLPVGAAVSDGTRTIILTITISAGAALLFPQRKEEEKLV
ncbi:MAG: hypothetical protein SOX72_03630 [Oscillospiraceae bacterium]|nr:hypothetical protein [Oscillospiraceae bacterium]MDY4191290.1 hypothetical protein [Oscillospiraceae bacterium]